MLGTNTVSGYPHRYNNTQPPLLLFCVTFLLLCVCGLSFDPETFWAALNFTLKKMLNCPMRDNLCCTTHGKNVYIFKKCIMSVIITTMSLYVYVKEYDKATHLFWAEILLFHIFLDRYFYNITI